MLHHFLPRQGQDLVSQPLHVNEWQLEILLADAIEHVEPFRSDHSELLVRVVQPIEPLLEVQELQIHFEDMQQETVIASPMQKCSTENVHSRDAATGCWTCEKYVSSSS